MSERGLDTEMIRRAADADGELGVDPADFDAWLAETVRAAKAEGWDEAVEEAFSLGSLYDYDRDETLTRNPYREVSSVDQ